MAFKKKELELPPASIVIATDNYRAVKKYRYGTKRSEFTYLACGDDKTRVVPYIVIEKKRVNALGEVFYSSDTTSEDGGYFSAQNLINELGGVK